jgi:hypothetical protein
MVQSSETDSFGIDDFIAAIRDYRGQEADRFQYWIDTAKQYTRHPGMAINMNLFMDPEGRIWTHGAREDGNGEMVHGFVRYSPHLSLTARLCAWLGWNEFGEFVRELPEGTRRGHIEDWVWVSPSRIHAEEEGLAYTFKEIRMFLDWATASQRNIAFADYLLSRDRDEFEKWFHERAKTSDRDKDGWKDREAFFEEFGKTAGFASANEIRGCTNSLIGDMQLLLDDLAGRSDIQRWY